MHQRWLKASLWLGLAALLAACTLQTHTQVEPAGTGEVRFEIGLTVAEQQMARTLGSTPEAMCRELAAMGGSLPGGSTLAVDERGLELWCIYSRPFADLTELHEIYAEMEGVTVNQIDIVDGIFIYDVEAAVLGMQLPEIPAVSMDVRWQLTVPGRVLSTNAERTSGRALSWSLATDQPLRMTASSQLTGGGDPGWFNAQGLSWLAAGLLLLCCCGGLAGAAALGAFLLLRRRRPRPA